MKALLTFNSTYSIRPMLQECLNQVINSRHC